MAGPWEKYQSAPAPAAGPWAKYQAAPVAEPPVVDAYAPPATVPTANPMDSYAPPTATAPTFTAPGQPRTAAEVIQLASQAGLRGAADLAGTIYDLPNAAFMGAQWLANTADTALTGAQDVPSVGLAEAVTGNTGGQPFNLSDFIANKAGEADSLIPALPGNERAPPMTPEDMGSLKFMYDPIRFAAGAAGGGMGLASQAPKVAERQAANLSRRTFTDSLIEPYVAAPKTTIARDAAAGAGAGVGADVSPEEGPFAFLGPLMGALAGSTAFGSILSAGNAAYGAAENAIKGGVNVGGEYYTRPQINEAARRLQEATRNPLTGEMGNLDAAAQIAERGRVFADLGGPVPDAGLLTDNLGIRNLGHDLRVRDKASFQQNDADIREAATARVNSLRDPEADQGAVARRAEGARLERLAPLTQEVDARQAAVNDIAGGAANEGASYEPFRSRPEHYRTDASRRLDQNIVDDSYLPAREQKNALYDQVDPDRSEFVSIEPLRGTLQQIRNQVNEFGPEALQMPADFVQRIQAILNRAAPDEDMMASVGELAGLRPFIATARANARRGGNLDVADNLGRIQNQIDGIIGDHPAAAEANRNYRDNFAPTFRPGPGDEAAKFTKQIDREPFGEGGVPTRTQTPPERTADRFLSAPEKAAAVDRLIQASTNPEAGRRAVRDYFMSDFASSAFNNDGTVNPQRANAWLQNNEPTLSQFPTLLRDFEQRVARSGALSREAQAADTELTAARNRLQNGEREVERGAIGTLLREDPRDVAKGLLAGGKYGSGRTLDEINQIIGDDETARRGWQAAVAETLSDMTSGVTKMPDGDLQTEAARLSRMMKQHEDDLAQVFDEEQMSTLRQGQALLETFQNIPKGAVGGSNTADKMQAIWRATEAALKARYGVLKGGGLLRTLRIALESLPNSERTIEALMRRAYFNPDVMEYLLTSKIRNLPRGESNKRLRMLLSGYVASAGGDNAPEEE